MPAESCRRIFVLKAVPMDISNKEKYITVTAEKFRELEEWAERGRNNEAILTIQTISRFHVCGDPPDSKLFKLEQAELEIRQGYGLVSSEIHDVVRFNKQQIEEMVRREASIQQSMTTLEEMRKEYAKMINRDKLELSKIPKWIRRIFRA